jgi:hypothetical protein
MPDLFPISLADQIACVEREIDFRHRVYGRRVAEGKMPKELADREITRMQAVLATLKSLAGSKMP